MTDLEERLRDILDPIRSSGVEALLSALAAAIEAGGDVEAEPARQEPGGSTVRSGPLSLPLRGDLAVTRDGRRLVRRIEESEVASFDPVTFIFDGGFTSVIGPFQWGAAELLVEAAQEKPDWGPLRLWYLEWFQARRTDVAPDLAGVLHGLEGPYEGAEGWRFRLDFGSAPVTAASDLVAAVMHSGARRMRLSYAE